MPPPPSPTHAGAVVFRRADPDHEYLVVSSSSGGDWVLPKGHIEPGEASEAAALREVREEAAITAEIVAPLGAVAYTKGGEEVRAAFFLMRLSGEVAPMEQREVRWLRHGEARALLTFEDARGLLDEAERRLADQGP